MALILIYFKPKEPIRRHKHVLPCTPYLMGGRLMTKEEMDEVYALEDEDVFQARMDEYKADLAEWERDHPGEDTWAEKVSEENR